MHVPLAGGFFFAGFECSDHRLETGRRLDLLTATRHEEFAAADYARLRSVGIQTCREGLSWVRCEPRRGEFDFSSTLGRLAAGVGHGIQIYWDVMHFGWPDHVDVFAIDFPQRFARFAQAFARHLAAHPPAAPLFTLINEMSFLAWAGGDVACMNPFAFARSPELKTQLVLATLAGIQAVRAVAPEARFLQSEPLIHIVRSPTQPLTWRQVECDNLAQFEALDMLQGLSWARLGGGPGFLDVIGVNVYPNNQFMLDGTTIPRSDPRFKPLAQGLVETWNRYHRPMIISETGSEGGDRAGWLRYVADQCVIAMGEGCELHGITLYPILNHPGWLDDRHCHNGLWDYADDQGRRALDETFAHELQRQTPRLNAARDAMLLRRLELSA
jgi:hypothetical protein